MITKQPRQDIYMSQMILTFQPIVTQINKRFERKGSRYSLHKEADATLESKINFADIVKLPPDEELEDFIAFHVVDFYNRLFLMKTLHWTVLQTSISFQS